MIPPPAFVRNHRANSHPPQHPHWESNFAASTLRQVNAACITATGTSPALPDDQLSRVANRRRYAERLEFDAYGDSRCIDEVGEGTQP